MCTVRLEGYLIENKNLSYQKIDNNYIKWLYDYSEKHSSFDDSGDYSLEKTEKTKRNVILISNLYEIIESYANCKGISANKLDSEFFLIKSYYVKCQDKIFQVGVISEDRTIFYCSLLTDNDNIEAIDINNILKYNKRQKVKSIKNLKKPQKTKLKNRILKRK